MSLWITATIFAAFMQNLRFMLQKQLKAKRLTTAGATFSRFLFSLPFVVALLGAYWGGFHPTPPVLGPHFWPYILIGGLAQIIATACVVALFAERNFTVGIALKKSEVILTALIGLVVLGEGISWGGMLAIAIGFCGVILLSDPPQQEGRLPWRRRLFNKASGYGLGSGLLFGVSAVGYRGATLEVGSPDVFFRALITLAVAIGWQVIVMSIWLIWRDRAEIGRVIASWRISIWTGVTSLCGSFGWFVAFTLQNAAYVKALGQVELLFTFLTSYLVFHERSSGREILGVLLLLLSILTLILLI